MNAWIAAIFSCTASSAGEPWEPVIKVEGLKKYFGDVRAVDDISFEVERGELFGFLGINGAGKSSDTRPPARVCRISA